MIKKALFIVFQLIIVFLIFNVSDTFAHSPHDVISILEISPSYDQDETLFIVILNKLLKSTDGGFSWKEIVRGLDNESMLSSIAVSPSFQFDKTLFISSRGDGIYKSQDGGSSWFKVNNGLGNLNIRLLAVSPDYRSDEIVLAAGTKGGLCKSKNGGKSWHQVIDNSIKVTAIAYFSGLKKDHILVGDLKGILYVSTDSGESWRKHFQIPDGGAVTSITVSPNVSSDNTYFVGTEKGGVLKTVDCCASHVALNNGLTAKHITSLAISPDYETDSTIFAGAWYEAVFRSDDGGKTWKKYSTGVTTDRQADDPRFKSPHFRDLRISKTFGKDRTIFLGGFDGLFKSTDGGNVWTQMETLSPKPIVGLTLSPGYRNDSTVAIATFFGGAYITDDQGTTWEVINKGLKSSRLSDIAFSPNFSSDNSMFTISNFAFYRSTDRGNKWDRIKPSLHKRIRSIVCKLYGKFFGKPKAPRERITFPLVIAISPDFVSDSTIYLGTRYKGAFRSVDGGVNWTPIWNANGGWISSLVISPDFSSDRTIYAGVLAQGIYKTVDGGDTWHPIKNLTTFAERHQLYSGRLAISPNYGKDKIVFAGTAEGLFRTRDGGKSWQKLEGLAYGGNGLIRGIAISPNFDNDETLIISVKGRGLFKTIDGGATFAEIGHDLITNNHSVRLLRFSPAYSIDNTIYGAGEELFHSTDGGNTWKLIPRPIRYENKQHKQDVVHYRGNWEVLKDDDFSVTSVSHSNLAHNKAILNFVGTGVSWIGTESNDQGIAKVYIDGDFKGYVDQFSDTRNVTVRSYSITGLDYGPHTVMIEVTNTKNPESSGYRIEIDAFDVAP
ncbi:MAG: YCF48-related protein [Deltaproteobacteria bacterium]|jgi:photosystem II stability/assembly factor-like uncharacterized protein|nr:YCF48-related protein [Deltaproteobacteria bacterium]